MLKLAAVDRLYLGARTLRALALGTPRPRLFWIAYRMLGCAAEAEDLGARRVDALAVHRSQGSPGRTRLPGYEHDTISG